MKDHLGNNRVVMTQSGTVEQIKTDMILSGKQKCKRPTQAVLSRSLSILFVALTSNPCVPV